MTEAERITFLVAVLEGGNGAQFAEKIGAHKSAVSELKSGKRRIRRYIERIIAAYPTVSRDWLTTGEGYPGDITVDLVKSHYTKKIDQQSEIISHLLKRIEDLEGRLLGLMKQYMV